jgi:nucleotide-binding universal stress UspA family protein
MVRDDLRAALAAVSPDLLASGWVIGGAPGSGVVTVAEDLGADLVVTGSRARGRITRAVLGSVSTDILHHAPCDVLVVHPPD